MNTAANPLAAVTVLNTSVAGSNAPNATALLSTSVLSSQPPGHAIVGVGVLAGGKPVSLALANQPAGSAPGVTNGVLGTAGGALGTVSGVAAPVAASAGIGTLAVLPGAAAGAGAGAAVSPGLVPSTLGLLHH